MDSDKIIENLELAIRNGKAKALANSKLNEGLEAPELIDLLLKLLKATNKVIRTHRKGWGVYSKDICELDNRQFEVEEALREMGF